jgi:hypothetical protein
MAAATSGADERHRPARTVQRFGTVVVVGGGCYGSYYLRQLGRAAGAGALSWDSLLVVDRSETCAATAARARDRLPPFSLAVSSWGAFFSRYLDECAADPERHAGDAIVPSPLMPHLMAGWLLSRARDRWPHRNVSFAEWMCPINCIEPPRCPHTRDERTWSLPVTLASYAESERAAGRGLEGPFVFHCSHRAFGVGMLDVADVVAADRAIALRGDAGPASFLVGTASHCHGALQRIVVGA